MDFTKEEGERRGRKEGEEVLIHANARVLLQAGRQRRKLARNAFRTLELEAFTLVRATDWLTIVNDRLAQSLRKLLWGRVRYRGAASFHKWLYQGIGEGREGLLRSSAAKMKEARAKSDTFSRRAGVLAEHTAHDSSCLFAAINGPSTILDNDRVDSLCSSLPFHPKSSALAMRAPFGWVYDLFVGAARRLRSRPSNWWSLLRTIAITESTKRNASNGIINDYWLLPRHCRYSTRRQEQASRVERVFYRFHVSRTFVPRKLRLIFFYYQREKERQKERKLNRPL